MKLNKHIILYAIFIYSIGCSNWRMVNKSEYHNLKNENHRIQVNLVDGTHYETQNYIFHSDSLIILTPKTLFYRGHSVPISFEAISNIKKQEIDSRKVILLGIGSVLIFYTIFEIGRGLDGAGDALK